MATLNEGNYLGDLVKHEDAGRMSRELVTVLAGSGAARALALGEVVGKRIFNGGTIAADAGNTGDGEAGAVVLGPDAIPGDYVLTCITAAVNGGVFGVIDPNGAKLEDLTVAVAYLNDHFGVTIADGAADFVVGDKFTVTVAVGDEKVVALDLDATDGSEVAAGVMIGAYSAADGVDGVGVAIVRNARLDPRFLTWPDGITAGQKATALAQLKALGVLMAAEG